MPCKAKHTKYQPPDGVWKCPNCGADADYFYVREYANAYSDDFDFECELLHEEDIIVCEACNKEWNGKAVARLLQERCNLTKCPCCNGTGFVKKGFER